MTFTPRSPRFCKVMSSEVADLLAVDFPPHAREAVFGWYVRLEWRSRSVDAAIALNDQIEARLEEITTPSFGG